MKKILFSTAVYLTIQTLFAATLEIVPDKFQPYKAGEKITFKATAYGKKKELLKEGSYTVVLRYSGRKKLGKEIKIDLAGNNPAFFTASSDRSGFILAVPGVLVQKDGKKVKWSNSRVYPALGGASVEPHKIRQAGKEAADFDEFWRKRIKEFEKAKVRVTPAPRIKRKGYKVSIVRVTFPDGKEFIEGFLSVPEKKGKYPALAGVPGAGPGVSMANPAPYIRGNVPAIELYMNVHLFPVERTLAEQRKRYAAYNRSFSSKLYYRENDGTAENYIYAKVWPAVSKAMDYVASLPEYDGKHFAATGNSQGGGTALALAYLNKNVTCVASSVPALCDHYGYLLSRQAGWPQMHRIFKDEKQKRIIPYFDCASFAKRVKVPAIFSIGYVDTTCSPSSVYAAYNNLKGEKKIISMYRSGHRITEDAKKEFRKFLDKHLTK